VSHRERKRREVLIWERIDRTSESSGRTVAPISVIPPPKAASVSRESQASTYSVSDEREVRLTATLLDQISTLFVEPPAAQARALQSSLASASAPIPASIVTSARLSAPSYNPLSASPFSLTKPIIPRPTARPVASVPEQVSVYGSDNEEATGGIVAGPVLFDDKEWDF
jgi:hypothetical protein